MRHGVAAGLPARGRLVVAVSGGRDSMVLLHLLRFGGVDRERLVAAHLDHGLRPGSAADADWVRGVCRAWGIALVEARLVVPAASEGAARKRRWAFLEAVRAAVGAVGVVTAHHGDDQAETVLHHIARGTGLRGLRAMRVAADGRLRPLLHESRESLEAYAAGVGLSWRDDPSNADPAFTRNRLRHIVLPALEEAVPGSGDALRRLARVARREEAALAEATEIVLSGMLRERRSGRIALDRDGLLAVGDPLKARILRRAAREVGGRLDATGTRLALAFTSRARSGREVHLTGAMRLTRELDAFVLHEPGSAGAPDAGTPHPGVVEIRVCGGAGGSARLHLASGPATLHWGPARGVVDDGTAWQARLDADGLSGPLRVRPWRPGDRIRLRYGTKKLKKLLAEARLDRERRRGHPVVEDAEGRIVWVPGVPDAVTPALRGETLQLRVVHEAVP